MKRLMAALLVSLSGLVAARAGHAHHSYTEFANDQTVEIEGTLVVVAWQNPHIHMEVQTLDENGRNVVWDIETASSNSFTRAQVPHEAYKVGEVVKIAGWPSKRKVARMYATNLLGSGAREVVTQHVEPRWGSSVFYIDRPKPTAPPNLATAAAPTLFRVWSSDTRIDPDTSAAFLRRAPFSLTDAAKKAVAAFDPVTQSTSSSDCTPKAMPILMAQPHPIEFVDRGDTIALRIEEYDAVRTIHMTAAPTATGSRSPLGYSVGRWDNGTLVVETTLIDAPYFNSEGVPLGRNAHTAERFTVSADGRRVAYTLTVTDPETFTEPVRAARAWIVKDGDEVLPYDCRASGARSPESN